VTQKLAVVDVTDVASDKVVAIPSQSLLMRRKEIPSSGDAVQNRVKDYFANSFVEQPFRRHTRTARPRRRDRARAIVREVPRVTEMERRDVPSAVIELLGPQGSLGTWLVSEYIDRIQGFLAISALTNWPFARAASIGLTALNS